MDNLLHSLRKSPVQWLRGRLPRSIEQCHNRTAAFSKASATSGVNAFVLLFPCEVIKFDQATKFILRN
jgi:hypothetical protein